MYFVYILKCADDSLYTGITTDVDRRFKEHKAGTASHYTRAHGAKEMIWTEESKDRSSASKREAEIKKFTRGEKLEMVKKKK